MAPNVLLFEVTLLKPIAQSKECREEEQVASFFQAYFGPISSIGKRENSPDCGQKLSQSRFMGPVSDLLRGGRAVLSHQNLFGFVLTTYIS